MLLEFNDFNTFLGFLNDQYILKKNNNSYFSKDPFIYCCHEKGNPDIPVNLSQFNNLNRRIKYSVKIAVFTSYGEFYFYKTYRGNSSIFKQISEFLREVKAREFRIIKSNIDCELKIQKFSTIQS